MGRAWILALTGICLAGCAGAGTGGIGGAGAFTEADRVTAADTATKEFVQLAGQTTAQKAAKLPGMWKAIPGFVDAGYNSSTRTYWGIFKDGVPFMYFDNRPPDAQVPRPHRLAQDELPIGKKLVFFDSMGTAFNHFEDKIVAAVNKQGYSASASRGFVEELAAVSDVAGLHWSTHGGLGELRAPGATQNSVIYGLWTDTVISKTPTAQIATMIKNGELGIAGAAVDAIGAPVDENGNGKIDEDETVSHEGHYIILPKFVHNHMSFGENSSVWVDACSSGTDNKMIAEFLAKGADVYLGWDNVISGAYPTPIAFDRMLGDNNVTPKDDPPYRPENIFDVVGWLQRQGLDKLVSTEDGKTFVSTLKYFTASDENFALLRPTIEQCFVEESFLGATTPARLTIDGEFGAARNYERKVTVDDTPLTIKSWTSHEIICDLPNSGAGLYGPVVVRANGHDSNKVPITLYQVHFTYLFKGKGTLFYKWAIVANFRQDVHKARHKPWELPVGAIKTFGIMYNSTATVTSGGTYTVPGVSTEKWSGGGTVPVKFGAIEPTKYFNFFAVGDWDTTTGLIGEVAPTGYFPIDSKVTLVQGTAPPGIIPAAPAVQPFTIVIDQNYILKGGSETLPTTDGTGTLTWGDTGGVFAPDSMTPARKHI